MQDKNPSKIILVNLSSILDVVDLNRSITQFSVILLNQLRQNGFAHSVLQWLPDSIANYFARSLVYALYLWNYVVIQNFRQGYGKEEEFFQWLSGIFFNANVEAVKQAWNAMVRVGETKNSVFQKLKEALKNNDTIVIFITNSNPTHLKALVSGVMKKLEVTSSDSTDLEIYDNAKPMSAGPGALRYYFGSGFMTSQNKVAMDKNQIVNALIPLSEQVYLETSNKFNGFKTNGMLRDLATYYSSSDITMISNYRPDREVAERLGMTVMTSAEFCPEEVNAVMEHVRSFT